MLSVPIVINYRTMSILPNFVFLCFPICAVNLSHFVTKKYNLITMKRSNLLSKNRKIVHFTKEKVWMTP